MCFCLGKGEQSNLILQASKDIILDTLNEFTKDHPETGKHLYVVCLRND